MVGDPIEDHLEAQPVGFVHESPEVRLGAELGIDRAVVAHRIGAAQRALAVRLADRVDRHQPDDIDAHRGKARELLLRRLEGALGSELTGVQLVEHRIGRPVRVGDLDDIAQGIIRLGQRGACSERDRQQSNRQPHHAWPACRAGAPALSPSFTNNVATAASTKLTAAIANA